MKARISKEEIQRIVDNPEEAKKAKVKVTDPWWIIALKVVSYLIGLVLAGAATVSCTRLIV